MDTPRGTIFSTATDTYYLTAGGDIWIVDSVDGLFDALRASEIPSDAQEIGIEDMGPRATNWIAQMDAR